MPWALYFDGIDDYVHIPLEVSADLGNCRYAVVQGYFKDMNPGAVSVILSLTISDNVVKLMVQTHTVSSADASRYGAGARSQASDTYQNKPASFLSLLPPFQEHFIRVKIDIENNDVLLWADGQPLTMSGTVFWPRTTFTAQVGNDTCFIGRRSGSPPDYFRGYIRGLEIWGEDTLIVRYPTNEGTGSVLTDTSGNDYHGTIHGATWVWVDEPVPPGRVDISATLRGSSSAAAKADHIRGLSAHLAGAATATGGTPIRIRGLSANLEGAGTTNVRMNLIAALKARLRGAATLKANALVLYIPEGVYVIDADEIFAKDQPSRGQTVVNHVEVWVNPLKPVDEPEEVYRSKDPVTIPAGKTETVTIQFDDEPVTEPAVVLEEAGANLSIVDTKYYAWGAEVTIKNAGSGAQTCRIVATGKPLKVQGREVIVKRDEVSIKENGLKKYTFDNPFVQDRATAELIADKLLSFSNAKRDIVIEWRGDPALQLADVVMIPEYQRRGLDQRGIFYVTKQELEFDGGLRAKLEGRKM